MNNYTAKGLFGSLILLYIGLLIGCGTPVSDEQKNKKDPLKDAQAVLSDVEFFMDSLKPSFQQSFSELDSIKTHTSILDGEKYAQAQIDFRMFELKMEKWETLFLQLNKDKVELELFIKGLRNPEDISTEDSAILKEKTKAIQDNLKYARRVTHEETLSSRN